MNDAAVEPVVAKLKASEPALKVHALSVKEDRREIRDAVLIHKRAIDAANKFHALFLKLRTGSKGTSSHDEQDLLRAMLVFACSGLDAVVKQLINDALPAVIENDLGAQKEFQKFVERRLKKGIPLDEKERAPSGVQALDTVLLASLLTNQNPREALAKLLTASLTADSLQSRDQLLKVAAHFALTREQVISNDLVTKDAFKARNEIIHEMDVDLDGRKKRRQRTYDVMVGYSENMLSIGAQFITQVERKIVPPPVSAAAGSISPRDPELKAVKGKKRQK
jgi:hypothetical protein